MSFGMINPAQLDYYWPECYKIISDSFIFKVHTYGPDDLYEPIKSGRFQLWVASDDKIKGCVVTCVEDDVRLRICNIMALSGEDLPSWVGEMNENLTRFANDNNCYAIEAVTRAGFSKFVPDFVEDGRVYVKILGEKHV